MNHRTAVSLAVVAVVLCAAYGGYRLLGHSSVQSTDDAYVTADSVRVSARVSGQVTAVAVQDNQSVKAGQLLAQLDDRDYLATQAAATANVNAAQAQLKNLAAGIERQGAEIDQASARIRSTAASLKFAEANAQRYRNLSNNGAGTQEERQKAESELLGWQASRDRDDAAKVGAQKSLDVLKAQREVAQATLAKEQAALQQADLNVSYTRILAPADGMVGQRSVRTGAYVTPGMPLLALVPLHDAYVVANFRETQLAHMALQQPVQVRVDSFPDKVFKGHLDSVAPATGLAFSAIAPDNATGNFTKVVQRIPVKIVFEPDQPGLDHLRVGMSVIARVDTAREQH
ncbi:MAG: HlyD family secretion protein [Pseudomonas sp.]|uniref:HlyD family secretion protein n=1 Tax=Pseudomonas abieticivorans TaxID=2931382 RepID=UPI0020C03F42|nr:HlyD family secretion protein [Pseudomonas sp. PIA16]MDE1169026.1 HlyD family secretion protein [Pseudomonas sp.]